MVLSKSPLLRRVVTISTLVVAAAIYLFLLPLTIVCALLFDLINRNQFTLIRSVIFFAAYLLAELIGVVVAILLSVIWFDRRRFMEANFALQAAWAGSLYGSAATLFGLTERITIDQQLAEHIKGRPVVLLVRHVSTADTVFPSLFFAQPFNRRLRYVLKAELAFDPCLDIVGHRLPNAFVVRGKGQTDRATQQLKALASTMGEGDGILIFPEGTRFTERKQARLIERYQADPTAVARIRSFKRVLPPKLAGLEAIHQAVPDAAWVLMGHRGVDRATTFKEFAQGALTNAVIDMHLTPIQIDADRALSDQIDEAWHRLDDWIIDDK